MLWSTRDALQPSKTVSKLLDFLFILAILGSATHEAFVSSLRNMWTASRPYCIVKRLALCSTCSARPSLNVNTGSCWKTHQGLSVAKKAFCLTFYLLSACCALCTVHCHNLSCYFFQDFHMNEAITISPILTLRFWWYLTNIWWSAIRWFPVLMGGDVSCDRIKRLRFEILVMFPPELLLFGFSRLSRSESSLTRAHSPSLVRPRRWKTLQMAQGSGLGFWPCCSMRGCLYKRRKKARVATTLPSLGHVSFLWPFPRNLNPS